MQCIDCQELFGFLLASLERLNLPAQPLVSLAGLLEKRGPLFFGDIQVHVPSTATVSSHPLVDLWIEFLQLGAYDYLAKPLDRKELRRIVNNALERHRSA